MSFDEIRNIGLGRFMVSSCLNPTSLNISSSAEHKKNVIHEEVLSKIKFISENKK